MEAVVRALRAWASAIRFSTQGLAWTWVFFVCSLTSCVGGIWSAKQTIATAAEVQAKAFKLFEQYDADHQRAIVDEAREHGTYAQGAVKLREYRQRRKAVTDVLKYAGHATLMAESLIPLVERGLAKKSELDFWLAEIITAGIKISAAFKALGFDLLRVVGK
jgi:hypothetical protein